MRPISEKEGDDVATVLSLFGLLLLLGAALHEEVPDVQAGGDDRQKPDPPGCHGPCQGEEPEDETEKQGDGLENPLRLARDSEQNNGEDRHNNPVGHGLPFQGR